MLDREIAAILAALPVAPVDFGTWTLDTIPALRAARAALPVPDPPPTTTIHRDITAAGPPGAPDLTMRVYSPPQPATNRPCMLWIHGGGYIVGSALMVDVRLNRWVELLDCVVIAVDYRLAPEDPYPAALDDCQAALAYTIAHADEIGIDPTRTAVVGASAGGGLAAALALRNRDRGEPAVAAQVLIYPMLDDRQVTPSSGLARTPVWTRRREPPRLARLPRFGSGRRRRPGVRGGGPGGRPHWTAPHVRCRRIVRPVPRREHPLRIAASGRRRADRAPRLRRSPARLRRAVPRRRRQPAL